MLWTTGTYTDNQTYSVIACIDKQYSEVIIGFGGKIISAYKLEGLRDEYLAGSPMAKEVYKTLKRGIGGCKSSNGVPVPFQLGACVEHSFQRAGVDFSIRRFNSGLCGAYIASRNFTLDLSLASSAPSGLNLPYVKLAKETSDASFDASSIYVRPLEEIGLFKDTSWLKDKRYKVVTDEREAEELFSKIEEKIRTNPNTPIAFDTETTGLKINMFGKIGSEKAEELKRYNESVGKSKQKGVDKLVGFIYCLEPNVSYYFPAGNRKFHNLYSDINDPLTKQTAERIKAYYTVGRFRSRDDDMARYIRKTLVEDFGCDVILMERNRDILEKGYLVGHNGTFDAKVAYLYSIDINFREDSMILHQLVYKFRSTTSNRGESSALKYLVKREFGVDQLELTDFFDPNAYSTTKTKKKELGIDFSYMDLAGSTAYAPADGDFTLQLFIRYKSVLLHDFKSLEYIYYVEVLVSLAIAYMEFYGYRINEEKIDATRDKYLVQKAELEHKIRQMVGYSTEKEDAVFASLAGAADREAKISILPEAIAVMAESENALNLTSPIKVAELFYDVLKMPMGEKKSVSKTALAGLSKQAGKNGEIVRVYQEWKGVDTLLTKFFGRLQEFMYPSGFIFSHFGQISTATGRMSCSSPNAQQFPKSITAIIEPRKDCVMFDADFSQIEYRTLVALAGEEALKEKFRDPDMDYHTTMASLMYGVDYASVSPKQRGEAKRFNFGIPYGMGITSLTIGLFGTATKENIEAAKEKYELYFRDQPNVRKFFANVKESAEVYGYTETKWHRRRYYSFKDKDGNLSSKAKASALRQAGNAVIQGTAADIFKISVARNFSYIRRNGLMGKLFIVNMIHDEQLMECNVKELNPKRVLADVVQNMELKLDGFPPLYVGAGVGLSWKDAKGKMAEIHPDLANEYIEESKDMPIFRGEDSVSESPEEVLSYFNERVVDFRVRKITKYVLDKGNWGKPIHPVIGNLLSLQFDYGVNEEVAAKYTEANGYTKDEIAEAKKNIPTEQLKRFMVDKGIAVNPDNFRSAEIEHEVESDKVYEDESEEEGLEEAEAEEYNEFKLIDESKAVFGVGITELVGRFKVFVSESRGICGIDSEFLRGLKDREGLIAYLNEHICEKGADGSMELMTLVGGGALTHSGQYVRGVTRDEMLRAARGTVRNA